MLCNVEIFPLHSVSIFLLLLGTLINFEYANMRDSYSFAVCLFECIQMRTEENGIKLQLGCGAPSLDNQPILSVETFSFLA